MQTAPTIIHELQEDVDDLNNDLWLICGRSMGLAAGWRSNAEAALRLGFTAQAFARQHDVGLPRSIAKVAFQLVEAEKTLSESIL